MSLSSDYAKQLMEKVEFERDILGFKVTDEEPKNIPYYGDDMSMMCAIAAEAWEKEGPFYFTRNNCVCGGTLYGGIGTRKVPKEEREAGMSVLFGEGAPYGDKKVFRKIGQQIQKHFKHHKYLIVGKLKDMEEPPDLVHFVGNANQIYRLTKAYTWETGTVVQGMSGTSWCAMALPKPFLEKGITFTLGDHGGRSLMGIKDYELFCVMHFNLVPMIIKNLDKAL